MWTTSSGSARTGVTGYISASPSDSPQAIALEHSVPNLGLLLPFGAQVEQTKWFDAFLAALYQRHRMAPARVS
jgi:hypothetical protein